MIEGPNLIARLLTEAKNIMKKAEAYFGGEVRSILRHEFQHAQKSILLFNPILPGNHFNSILCMKAYDGVEVRVVLRFDFEIDHDVLKSLPLIKAGGQVYLQPKRSQDIMIEAPICIIDGDVVVLGSYSLLDQAPIEFENISISYNNHHLIDSFFDVFQYILSSFNSTEYTLHNPNQIINRLKIIKNTIALNEYNLIDEQLLKIKEFSNIPEIEVIIKKIQEKDFLHTLQLIDTYINKNSSLAIYTDYELKVLHFQILCHETHILIIEDEKTNIEEQIDLFRKKQNDSIGEVMLKMLGTKRKYEELRSHTEIGCNSGDFKNINEEYKRFEKFLHDTGKEKNPKLTKDDSAKLKQSYKEASKLCHPDKVEDKHKEAAHNLFLTLQEAYDKNNIEEVIAIKNKLEHGDYLFTAKSAGNISQKDSLKTEIKYLKSCINKIINDVCILKKSKSYIALSSNSNWDDYFDRVKVLLEKEIDEFKDKITIMEKEVVSNG